MDLNGIGLGMNQRMMSFWTQNKRPTQGTGKSITAPKQKETLLQDTNKQTRWRHARFVQEVLRKEEA